MALSCLIMLRLYRSPPSAALTYSLLTELHFSVHFPSIPTAQSPKAIAMRAVSLDGTFWSYRPWCFHLQKCCDQWKPGLVLFFRGVYAGGKQSSPCEIGSRESSADQPVCRLWEDILWTTPGYSTLYCTSLTGLASHGSNLQMAIITSLSETAKESDKEL